MRTAPLAAALAAALSVLSVAAVAGLGHWTGPALFAGTPVRPHIALGPVAVLARPDPDVPATPLAEAARARYGQVDALADVRVEPLPWSDAALISGIALRWQ